MRMFEMKIPTRHGMWMVQMPCDGYYNNDYVEFYSRDAKWHPQGWRHMEYNEIPTTIWKRVRSFLAAPERFGKVVRR